MCVWFCALFHCMCCWIWIVLVWGLNVFSSCSVHVVWTYHAVYYVCMCVLVSDVTESSPFSATHSLNSHTLAHALHHHHTQSFSAIPLALFVPAAFMLLAFIPLFSFLSSFIIFCPENAKKQNQIQFRHLRRTPCSLSLSHACTCTAHKHTDTYNNAPTSSLIMCRMKGIDHCLFRSSLLFRPLNASDSHWHIVTH